jgi:hypothetical protein
MSTVQGLEQRIQACSFDSDKLAVVKQAAQTNTIPWMVSGNAECSVP